MIKKLFKKKDFFTSLIISYIVVIFISTFLMGYVTTHNFTKTYVSEVNSTNQKIINYINTLINESVIAVTDELYTEIESGPSSRTFRKFTDTHDYNQVDTMVMYHALRDYVAQHSDLIYAIHLYSIKTEDIISSQYGYKTPGNATVNRDFIELSKGVKVSRWIPTRSVRHSYSEAPENILTKVFHIGNTDGGTILAFDIRENDLYNIISRFTPDKCKNIILTDDKRTVLSHTDKNMLSTVLNEDFGEAFSDANGHLEKTLNGEKSVISFSAIANSDWRIIMVVSAADFYPSLHKTFFYAIVIAIISIVTALLFAYFYSLRLSAPIKKLTSVFSEKSQSKELSAVVSNIFEEFGELNETISKNKLNTQRNFIICSYYQSFNSTEDMEARSMVMQHEFSHDMYMPLIINITANTESSDDVIYSIMSSIENTLGTDVILSKVSNEKIAVLLGLSHSSMPSETEKLLTDSIENYNEYVSFFYIGETIYELSKLPSSFAEILKLYEYGFFYPDKRFLYYSDLKIKIEKPGTEFGLEFIPDELNEDDFKERITGYCRELTASNLSAKDMHHELLKATHNLAQFLSRQSIRLDEANRFFENGAGVNINNFCETMQKILNEYFEKKQSLVNDKNFIVMQSMKQYIEENYKSNVSLTSMSDALGIHTTNLSRIFKTETGKNLSDYIKDFKLSKARELLLTTELSVNEIASELDYNTVHYFIRIFKEKYGETPKVFRQMNRQ